MLVPDSEYEELTEMHSPKKMLQLIGKKSEFGALPLLEKQGLRECQYKAEINLEKQKIAERRKILNKEIVQQQAQRKHWWLKGEKYDRLKKRIKKQLLNQMLYQDELEQEEKYNGRSQEN